jgi:hypothetical protein
MVKASVRCRQPHPVQKLHRLGARSARTQAFVLPEHLGDLMAYGEDGIQGGHWFLEDHADVLSADPAQVTWSEAQEICAAEEDLA